MLIQRNVWEYTNDRIHVGRRTQIHNAPCDDPGWSPIQVLAGCRHNLGLTRINESLTYGIGRPPRTLQWGNNTHILRVCSSRWSDQIRRRTPGSYMLSYHLCRLRTLILYRLTALSEWGNNSRSAGFNLHPSTLGYWPSSLLLNNCFENVICQNIYIKYSHAEIYIK